MGKLFETIDTQPNWLSVNPTLPHSNLGPTYDLGSIYKRIAVSLLGCIVLPVTVPTITDYERRIGRSPLRSANRKVGSQLTAKTIVVLLP